MQIEQKRSFGRGCGAVALGLALVLAGCDNDDGPPVKTGDAAAGAGGVGGTGGSSADAASGTGGADAAVSSDGAAADMAQAPDGGVTTTDGSPSGDGGADAAAPPPPDTDIAVVRLNADGTLDTTFGTSGIARIDFGGQAGNVRDSLWAVSRDATNRIVLFGAKKGDGARVDADRVVARLTANGVLDTSFATMGMHVLNVANLSDAARNGLVQADGKIMMAGYTAQPSGVGTQTTNKIVLLRLLDNGMPDATFGFQGIANVAAFVPAEPTRTEWGFAEAYGITQQGAKYVTTGYGRPTSTGTLDMVSVRFTETGAIDPTWGTNGVVTLDVVGQDDRGRNAAALPGDRILIVGSGKPTATDINAMAVILGPNGALDTTFDTDGSKLYDFGRPDEAFYGLSVAPSGKWAAAAGYRAGAVGGVMEDDDATLLLLPIDPAGTEVAKAVPLSETQNDRFWGVAFDATDRVYAAGFSAEAGDNRMTVARYTTAGALDPTFGTAGVAVVNVTVAGGTVETARGIVLQSDGKIIIAGEVEKR
jgi:uncharacterized delta-60 repeat protein